MRTCSSPSSLAPQALCFLTFLAAIVCSWPAQARIDAEKGRNYPLTSKHGPWMIMVTSIWGETPEKEEQALKASHEMVYQLRLKGIPAYLYKQEDQIEEIESIDRQGRPTIKKLTAQHGMIGVLAGNYPSLDDEKARKTLKIIKELKLKTTVNWHGKKQEIALVTAKAFLTPNPLLPPGGQVRKSSDPLIAKLNSGDHTLFENNGKYTLVVASFYGQSQVKPREFAKFDKMLASKGKISLDNAARESWELMQMLRSKKVHGGPYDAYVFHDRFRSIVTVGSFKSKNDPEIARLIELFKSKEAVHPDTKQKVIVCESIQMPAAKRGEPPRKAWTLDPVPQLMEVPR